MGHGGSQESLLLGPAEDSEACGSCPRGSGSGNPLGKFSSTGKVPLPALFIS